eukprot:Gregarina_sp_Poly_1__4133@NODE_2262_length_2386_cov_141_220785_g1450_i0_p2_GENE_NODE_2262_length_2386_cov_141_220785_g1450_i0NODE_2262_length_2386_cov_141_220785_g1450_i0_p2_ORF_typecomplete_len167_score13_24Asp/PF00026_23/2_8e10TAXi_N/PF14543_6/6_4e03TAXi_N/PF14543_6/7_2e05SNAP25/PF00835_19/0_35SNAP25/PF00835_19/6_9e03_NODE_2262_length_2386_cov_141_220785_g1450_i012011701
MRKGLVCNWILRIAALQRQAFPRHAVFGSCRNDDGILVCEGQNAEQDGSRQNTITVSDDKVLQEQPEMINQKEPMMIKNYMFIPYSEMMPNHFVSEVKIGTPPQTLHVLLDSGSANPWVVGDICRNPSCHKVKPFITGQSASLNWIYPNLSLAVEVRKIYRASINS